MNVERREQSESGPIEYQAGVPTEAALKSATLSNAARKREAQARYRRRAWEKLKADPVKHEQFKAGLRAKNAFRNRQRRQKLKERSLSGNNPGALAEYRRTLEDNAQRMKRSLVALRGRAVAGDAQALTRIEKIRERARNRRREHRRRKHQQLNPENPS